jgi:hypothetical protein
MCILICDVICILMCDVMCILICDIICILICDVICILWPLSRSGFRYFISDVVRILSSIQALIRLLPYTLKQ